jgi:hypothetical protein
MSEFETTPNLVRIFQHSNDTISKINKFHSESIEKQGIAVQTPLSYISRYVDCYKIALNQRDNMLFSLKEAYDLEQDAKLKLEELTAQDQISFSLEENSFYSECKSEDDINQDYIPVIFNNNASQVNSSSKEGEIAINTAKLFLAKQEDNYERLKINENKVTKRVHMESKRLDKKEKRILMVIYYLLKSIFRFKIVFRLAWFHLLNAELSLAKIIFYYGNH